MKPVLVRAFHTLPLPLPLQLQPVPRRLISLRATPLQSLPSSDPTYQAKYQQLMDSTRLSLAPMMEYTDRHFRHLIRLISQNTLVYTEMVSATAISHERRDVIDRFKQDHPEATDLEINMGYDDLYLKRYLQQSSNEGSSVLQLGGSDPAQMHEAALTIMDLTNRGDICDYTAINLNCGCPSPKVAGKGCFGAALMDDAPLVADLCKSLHDGCDGKMPITVKCRIGTDSDNPFTKLGYEEIDAEQEYSKLCRFIETVASGGVVTDFSIHARIAVLTKSFSPADNRKIPPLKYDFIRRLVEEYPELTFSLNGGLESISQAQTEFDECPDLKGVMIGRALAANPWSFAMADKLLYGQDVSPPNRLEILKAYGHHADREEANGDPLKIRRFITKAVTPLFAGEPNSKKYRIALDEIAGTPKMLAAQGKTLEGLPPISELILNAALDHLSEDVLLRTAEESYERLLAEKNSQQSITSGGRSEIVQEWQEQRKQEGPSKYEETLSSGI